MGKHDLSTYALNIWTDARLLASINGCMDSERHQKSIEQRLEGEANRRALGLLKDLAAAERDQMAAALAELRKELRATKKELEEQTRLVQRCKKKLKSKGVKLSAIEEEDEDVE